MAPARINTCRGIAVWVLRAVAFSLLAGGAYLILKRVAMFVVTRDASAAFEAWEGIGASHPLYAGLAMVAVGAAIGAWAGRIARWIFTVPASGCPRCGYEKIEQDRCPECGLSGFAGRID